MSSPSLPHETAEQIVHLPVPQTQEQSAVTDAVEVVDSFSVSEEVATLADMKTHNTSSTPTSRDRLDELAGMLDSCFEQLTLLAAMGEETERIEMLTKRMMETPSPAPPLVDPPLVESADRTSAKRRRRTRYTSLSGIMGTRQCTRLQVRRRLYDTLDFERVTVWTVYEMTLWAGAWHPPTLSWVPLSFVLFLHAMYLAILTILFLSAAAE